MKRLPDTSTLPPYSGTVILRDEGQPLGSVSILDFAGAGVTATISGAYANISIPGGGGGGGGADQIGVYGLDDGVPLGTGTSLDAGDFLQLTLSGTRLRADVLLPPEPAEQIGIMGLDDGVPVGTGTSLDAGDFLQLTLSGARLRADVLLPPEPAEQIGVYALDDGVPVGTGTSIDFGDNLTATLSGTRLRVDAAASATLPPITGSVVVEDEGFPLGSVTALDFVGDGVSASISGAVARISIPGLPGSGSTYMLVGQPDALDGSTGTYWRVPAPHYATGTLAVFVDGLAQQLGTSFVEQYPASGTYQYLERPSTGSFHLAIWGAPASGGGSSSSVEPRTSGTISVVASSGGYPLQGVAYGYPDGVEAERLFFNGAVLSSGVYDGGRPQTVVNITGGYRADFTMEDYTLHASKAVRNNNAFVMPLAYVQTSDVLASGTVPHSTMHLFPFMPRTHVQLLGLGFRTVTTVASSLGRMVILRDNEGSNNARFDRLVAEADFVLSTGSGIQYVALSGSASRIVLEGGFQYWAGIEFGPSGTNGPSVVQWPEGMISPILWYDATAPNDFDPPSSDGLFNGRFITKVKRIKSYGTVSGSAAFGATISNPLPPYPAMFAVQKKFST